MSGRYALIIASYDYQDDDLRELIAPAQDAEALGRALGSAEIGGFEVQTLVNEASHTVEQAVETFFADRKRNDLLLLYFSGHGLKDELGRLYFATVETKRKRLRSTALSANYVNEVMRDSRSNSKVLLLDCCYSGAFAEGMVAKSDEAMGTMERFRGRGRVVLTASDALQYAFEGDNVTGEGVRSVFTRNLVEGLETGKADLDQDGRIVLDELYEYVYERVIEELPNQQPEKWAFGLRGEIVIAQNPAPIAATGQLPPELLRAIENPIASVREGAVRELGRLLRGSHRGLALAAQEALERMTKDDSRLVSTAAAKSLGQPTTEVDEAAPAREEGSGGDSGGPWAELLAKLSGMPPRNWIIGGLGAVVLLLGALWLGSGGFTAPPPASPTATASPTLVQASSTTERPTEVAEAASAETAIPTATTVVATGTATASPTITLTATVTPPGGSGKLAFDSSRDGNLEIYVLDVELGTPSRLTNNPANDLEPAWSPDGERLAFESNRDGNFEIYVMDAEGSNPKPLTSHAADDHSPAWSPDGEQIAFESERDGNSEIYVMNADGSNPARLTQNSATDQAPAWSPDGKQIAFQSFRDGRFQIYVMDADGDNLSRLSDGSANDLSPAWSPDGKRIAFYSNRDGNREIYVMGADGSNPTRLTNNAADDLGPDWSPDGEKIAFPSVRQGNREIFVMEADGSQLTRLTDNIAKDESPDWAP